MPKNIKIWISDISRLHKKQKATKKDLTLSVIASSFAPNDEKELVPSSSFHLCYPLLKFKEQYRTKNICVAYISHATKYC